MPKTEHRFQVNLKGIIELLSDHLYGTPHVVYRELLQNGLDAITARKKVEPKHKGELSCEIMQPDSDQPTLLFRDNGIGLSEDEVHRFLATIGESSKRAPEDMSDGSFLGQFGIGLLSGFVLSDEVVMLTRSIHDEGPGYEWRGRADGSYSLRKLDHEQPFGTQVFLRAMKSALELVKADAAERHLFHYGHLLPVPISVVSNGESKVINSEPAPWKAKFATRKEEDQAVMAFGRKLLDDDFLDWVPLRNKRGGLKGIAYILQRPASAKAKTRHRVYLKNMLLTESAENLLPPWAFFVRSVVNVKKLRPTASRESFYEDEKLQKTRSELGDTLTHYLRDLADTDPARLEQIISIHYRSIKALASEDDDFFRVISNYLPFETSAGRITLREYRERESVVRYAPTVDQFRQIAAVAAAEGMTVINAGYSYDEDLLRKLDDLYPDVEVQRLDSSDMVHHLRDLTVEEHGLAADFLQIADKALAPYNVQASMRKFEPHALSVLYTASDSAEFRRSVDLAKEKADAHWGALMDALSESDLAPSKADLCFNFHNPLVTSILDVKDEATLSTVVQMLYAQSLLLGHHPLQSSEMDILNGGMGRLISLAIGKGE